MTDSLTYSSQFHSFYPQIYSTEYEAFTFPGQSAFSYYPMESNEIVPDLKVQRPKMKSAQTSATEQIKHRRTRSGCFTCRARRVKCDEARPICDRCAKGGRQCSFPEATPSKQSSSGGPMKSKKKKTSSTSGSASINEEGSSPEHQQNEGDFELDTNVEYGSFGQQLLHPYGALTPNAYSAPSSVHSYGSTSPNTQFPEFHDDIAAHLLDQRSSPYKTASDSNIHDNFLQRTVSSSSFMSSTFQYDQLDKDAMFFIEYHQRAINSHHYFFKLQTEGDEFFKSLLSYASQNKALLYAIVAFSCFHYHVENSSQQYENFLEYHNLSLSLLRSSFENNATPDLSTLLTILQISTLETYLNDWTSVKQHIRGAKTILTSIFSPESILASYEFSPILTWLTTIDHNVAIMTGSLSSLSQEWLDIEVRHISDQLIQDPDNEYVIAKFAETRSRSLVHQVVDLLDHRANGRYDFETFERAASMILNEIEEFWSEIPEKLTNSATFSAFIQPDNSTRTAAFAYVAEYWPINYIFAEVRGISLMLQHHLSFSRGYSPEYMRTHSIEIIKIIAATSSYNHKPDGSLLPFVMPLMQASTWIADPSFRPWFRSQFQEMEESGFIFSAQFRSQLSALWSETAFPSSHDSSNGNIISALRNLSEERYRESNEFQYSQPENLIRNFFSFVDLQS